MASSLWIIVVMAAVACTGASRYPPTKPNQCGTLHGVRNLDLSKITGDWYVIDFLSPNQQDKGRCLRERVVQLGPHSIQANGTGVNYDGICFHRLSTAIACELPDPTNAFAIIRGCEFRLTGIETDYTKYLAASFCQDHGDGTVLHFAFIWARRDCLPDKLVERLRAKLTGWGVDITQMYRVDQYECPKNCVPHLYAKCYNTGPSTYPTRPTVYTTEYYPPPTTPPY